jgi:hypothetical protein
MKEMNEKDLNAEKKETKQENLNNQDKCRELATKLYELDGEVYNTVGSALGRTFSGDRESTIRNLTALMYAKPDGHLLRSEMALVSNMARTIEDEEEKSRLMRKYDAIFQEIMSLPSNFADVDIMDMDRMELNYLLKDDDKLTGKGHRVICISRTQGSAANDIGFALADDLRINYYDVEIFEQVLRRLEAEKGAVYDEESFSAFDKYNHKKKFNIKEALHDANRYHGLPKQDAVFFNMSDLICDLAKKEECVIMGRCADVILKNNHIPHISIFITAPFAARLQHVMEERDMGFKEAARFLKKMDKQHKDYYNFYGGSNWGHPDNYDLCFNSASYGVHGTEKLILKLLKEQLGE